MAYVSQLRVAAKRSSPIALACTMDNGVLDPHPCIRADRGESVSRSCGGLNGLDSGPKGIFESSLYSS
jgi:hypothetical protein